VSRLLITGADGFLGQALCQRLQVAGHTVIGTVRSGERQGVVVVGDIGEFRGWPALLQGIDAVIHLAARAHITREVLSEPLPEFRRVNVAATLQLAGAAAAAGVRRFVFLSSIGVNGNHDPGRPFTESDDPRPVEPYAVSKWEAEQELIGLAGRSGLELTRIRPPLIVGPGAKGNLLRLMKLVATGLPLPLGAVHNSRSLIERADLCDLLELCVTHPRAANQLFLAADPEVLSTSELLRLVAAGLGKPSRLWPVPVALLKTAGALCGFGTEVRRLADSLRVDAARAREQLGWHPAIGLRRGICEMSQSYARRGPD
jgi:nucleoside-diphosphate-sugar epimerase